MRTAKGKRVPVIALSKAVEEDPPEKGGITSVP
jgi:hypothetical protein